MNNTHTEERELQVLNRAGIHLRVASQIVKLLNSFHCEAVLIYDGRTANAKSIMSITQLMAPIGSLLRLKIQGPEAKRAAHELEKLFQAKFNEE